MVSRAVGSEEHCKQISLACVGSARSVSATLGLAPSWRVCFPSLHCSGSRLLCQELSEAGPGLPALPRSKSLRLRFLGCTNVQTQLGLRFVPFLGPSSSGDQVLGERGHPQVGGPSYCLPRPSPLVFWVYNRHAFSDVPCVSSGELISGCDPPDRC